MTKHQTQPEYEMSRLALDGTAKLVPRDQIFRHERGQGNIGFPCPADHEQNWQPYPVDPYSAIYDDHTCPAHRVQDSLPRILLGVVKARSTQHLHRRADIYFTI